MTTRRRSAKEAHLIKLQLADIIQDVFDKNGQVVTHEVLAKRHVLRNGSLTAMEDVKTYGGPAVAFLRAEPNNYAVVPITGQFDMLVTGDPRDEVQVCNAVAGLGAGGPRIGWYQPSDQDDWLWVYYLGHLGRSGVRAVFHAARQAEVNPQLLGAIGRKRLAGRAVTGLPVPPGKTETKVLEARLDRKAQSGER